jgi:hypothetical protein
MGLQPFGRPWITIKELEMKYPGLANYTYGPTRKKGLIVDLIAKHAYVNLDLDFGDGDDEVKFGSTLYGRNFGTDFVQVYYESPY